jgi:hypothetical protein
MAWLYKRALDDSIGLSTFLVLVLLDDEIYQAQRTALINFVNALPPQKDNHELGSKVHTALCQRAGELGRQGMADWAAAYLWKLKQGAGPK